jgi:hypothetical protein
MIILFDFFYMVVIPIYFTIFFEIKCVATKFMYYILFIEYSIGLGFDFTFGHFLKSFKKGHLSYLKRMWRLRQYIRNGNL